MPNPRHSSKSPIKAQAFALSSVRPPQRQGAWRPPPVYCADGVTLYQDYVRAPPGQVGFSLNTSRLENLEGRESLHVNDGVYDEAHYITPLHSDAVPAPTAHSVAREKQAKRWVMETIPALLPVYVDLMYRTERLRHLDRATPSTASCICGKQKEIQVADLDKVSLHHCPCRPATQQLVARGFFPSSPVEPHLGVDMRVLDFAQDLFLNQAPNNRALTKTIEQCLDRLGYKLPNRESLRRQFGNALEYYVMLRHSTDQAIDNILATVRQGIQNEDDSHERPTTPGPMIARTSVQESPRKRGRREWDSSPPASPTKRTRAAQPSSPTRSLLPSSSSPVRLSLPSSPSRPPASSPEPSSPVAESSHHTYPFTPPEDRPQPSEYLRSRCPACFGGKWEDMRVALDCIVCGDACFTQKRNKDRGCRDPERMHPKSSFLPDQATQKMADWVEGKRPARSAPNTAAAPTLEVDDDDVIEAPSIPLPRSVLNECERSFAAADETRAKTSSQFFDDKGLMGLSCRHDNLLFLANIKTPGERQFYMFALLEALFQHLPTDFVVGFLYDIACQLQRSAVKYDFLPPEYMARLEWAVSVLHSYGHGAACQAVYHPRRRTLFGYSDGEGLERFWHSLSHLVSFLRVCGYHKRRYTLDAQIIHIHKGNLFRLGSWLSRRYADCCQHRQHATNALAECQHSLSVLRAEHAKQVTALSQPLPRQSKNAGKIAIQDVLRKTVAMDRLKNQMSQWNEAIYKEDADPVYVDFALQEYAKADAKLSKLAESVRRQKAVMGVEDKANLAKLVKSKYIQTRTNAAAAKTRLRNRLRQRKFELDRVEHAKMTTHIEDAVRRRDRSIKDVCRLYNRLCKELEELIRLGCAPRNAIAPREIIEQDIWALDVDAEIWLDVGLMEADEETEPPLWMKSDAVRQGIQAMLEQDRCNEEEPRLFHECRALRWWMAEEWEVVTRGMKLAAEDGEAAIVYQFELRKSELTKLAAAWEKPLRQVPYPTSGLPAWGPSEEDLLQVRIEDMFARTSVGSWKEPDTPSYQEDIASDSDSGTDTEYFPYDELDAFERAGDWRELQGISAHMDYPDWL
ncbi:unnamed protein product [Mycena citricolor]|uniref:CxC1-like cysteine cluster associated with KDZ transposases domain-containing protein n=1 Tax=Mycena citricolor TaxID=2018698 RepID=A0AAD2HVS9_9AGAR|nr:unnamed protein product [Mycena citricolor]